MNRNVVAYSLIATAVLGSLPGLALAQVRGSMIPPETLETALQRSDRMFERLDTDADGGITHTEVAAMMNRMQAQAAQARGGGGSGGGGAMVGQLFDTADKDADHRITRQEMRTNATERFRAQDRDGDGVLSDSERPGFPGRPGGGFIPPQTQDPFPPQGDLSGG